MQSLEQESSSYAALLASALMDPSRPTPAIVSGPAGKDAIKRYNVYRNNVMVGLTDALAAIFPAVQRITGIDFFRAMARQHVRLTPPTSPLLFEYGRYFPAFIESYEYARAMPWLADVARIERAWLDAYHAADAEPLAADALAAIPPARLAGAVFVAHPAAHIMRSPFSAVAIFAANRGEGTSGQIDASIAEDALITRPAHRRCGVPDEPDGRPPARRGHCIGIPIFPVSRPCREHRRPDRRGCLCLSCTRRNMKVVDQHIGAAERILRLGLLVNKAERLVRAIARPSLVQFVMRAALAVPFWKSGILKWDGFFQLSDTAVTLFTDEFMLHLPGGPYPFPAPTVMAFLSGCGEVTFPVLLVLGFGARFAALGLLFMTMIVELTVPDGWPIHLTWAAMALAIMAWGPGRISVDYWLKRVALEPRQR